MNHQVWKQGFPFDTREWYLCAYGWQHCLLLSTHNNNIKIFVPLDGVNYMDQAAPNVLNINHDLVTNHLNVNLSLHTLPNYLLHLLRAQSSLNSYVDSKSVLYI